MPELLPDQEVLQRRGLILATLRLQAPVPTAGAMLEQSMRPYYGQIRDLPVDVDYLILANLITRAEARRQGRLLRTYRLTALGYRVLDGTAADPGVAPPPSASESGI